MSILRRRKTFNSVAKEVNNLKTLLQDAVTLGEEEKIKYLSITLIGRMKWSTFSEKIL